MKALLIGLTALVALPALAVQAGEEQALEDKPGYVDFGELAEAYGEPRVMINIGSSLLRLVSAMKHEDPMAEAALRDMESVRVHVYNTEGDTAPAARRMDDVSELLAQDAWERIVQVREEDKQVDIYMKHGEDLIHGITVMAVDPEEAVFINVLGDINPAELETVMDSVDVDVDIDL